MTVGLTGTGAGSPVSQVDFSIEPLGSATFTTDGQGGLTVGSAEAISYKPIGGIIRFQLPVGIAGFGSATPLQRAIIPARRSADVNTAIAIRNLEPLPITVTLTMRGENGASLGTDGQVERQIPANGRVAQFIDELFENLNANDLVGIVEISSQQGAFSAISLELGSNAGQFTALPVIPVQEPRE